MRTFTIVGALLLAAASASARTRLGSHRRPHLVRNPRRDGRRQDHGDPYAGGTDRQPHMSLAKHNLIARHVAGQMAERLGNALAIP